MKKRDEVIFLLDTKPSEKLLSRIERKKQIDSLLFKITMLVLITSFLINLAYVISYWGGV